MNPLLKSNLLLFVFFTPITVSSQGTDRAGHPTITNHFGSARSLFAAWNFAAGKNMPEDYSEYPEFLPNLEGWDYRINLPHTTFQLLNANKGGEPAMVGVMEGSSDFRQGTLATHGHANNAIWVFRAHFRDGQMYFKVLPSRLKFDLHFQQVEAENIESLTADWLQIPPLPNVTFHMEKPAVAVMGEGIGNIKILVVARGTNNQLYFTFKEVSNLNNTWTQAWQPLGIAAAGEAALSEYFGKKAALAWHDAASGKIHLRLLDLTNMTWSKNIQAKCPAVGAPQLIWDGVALNLFYAESEDLKLQHAYILPKAGFKITREYTVFPLLQVRKDHFHVALFNKRLHVALERHEGQSGPSGVFYLTTTTQFGIKPKWAIPSETGLSSTAKPKIVAINENLFVIAPGTSAKILYSRKDPNKRGNDITGAAFADRWLETGSVIDNRTNMKFESFNVLNFNGDIYLCANKDSRNPWVVESGVYVINFSRAALKKLFTEKLGMELMWASPHERVKLDNVKVEQEAPDQKLVFAKGQEVPLVGDFNGDFRDDLVKFTQKNESGIGPAPVYVSLANGDNLNPPEVWHHFFSLKGEIPMVGDFNGDGKDDIITFTQKEQKFDNGEIIGPAVVWVSLSNGSSFQSSGIWHRFFSLKGEIPMVGDFNGDGKDDIITFTQKEQKFENGDIIGPAVVWVALSDGSSFQNSNIWHRSFSFKGEVPRIDDFNGDGKDDVASFVQKQQFDDSDNLIGNAPVWVALSNGIQFGQSSVWHTFFSLKGEVPATGDFNQDGKADIVTFLNGKEDAGSRKHNVFIAFSTGAGFERSITCHSNFGGENNIVMTGSFSGKAMNALFSLPQIYRNARFSDLISFDMNSGHVRIAQLLSQIPVPPGAPHERYKFFTDKGLGLTMFPERFWEQVFCLSDEHRFSLLGAAGAGGGNLTMSSVRPGGRQGHILEELGHSVFANCLRPNKDPFDIYDDIYNKSMAEGGLQANDKFGCIPDPNDPNVDIHPGQFYDCRDPEHYFIKIMNVYRFRGGDFRKKIEQETNPFARFVYQKQYQWLKDNWFNGLEFKGTRDEGDFAPSGFQCLPGECQLNGLVKPGVLSANEKKRVGLPVKK